MPSRIEDYALIGDCQTAALVGKDGSIDWLCLPRFDSPACFAALLGTEEHGRWRIRPEGRIRHVERKYRDDTLVLETEFQTDHGTAVVMDCMPIRAEVPDVIRIVVGMRGRVRMAMDLVIRFDYGSLVPWVRRTSEGITAVAGPDLVVLRTPVPLRGENFRTVAEFTVAEGDRVPFVLTWSPSNRNPRKRASAEKALVQTSRWWKRWSRQCTFHGEHEDIVRRSLITLKALTYAPTGGIVAAPTTSLPECVGGVRNWDYRLCWLRDATFTLYSLLLAGYRGEALEWRQWLLRAIAGMPSQIQIMYGLAGERRLTELELPWLPGYKKSKPVRVGNGAYGQRQLDVFGEVMDALYVARRSGIVSDPDEWNLQLALIDYLTSIWRKPDEGIWEVRGKPRHFTHSKVMAWVALDRAIKGVEHSKRKAPIGRWRRLRKVIHEDVCRKGFNKKVGAFVQSYGSKELDASLLMIPLVGFLPATDPRVRGTVDAIERHLMREGFVQRYATSSGVDGLPAGEGVFLACTFWLADCLTLLGRRDDARRIFKNLIALCNDVGLLSEQYDPVSKRLVGNFPQAFSHVSLINTARNLAEGPRGPAEHRRRG